MDIDARIIGRAGAAEGGPWQAVHRLLRALFRRTDQAEAEIAALRRDAQRTEDRHRAELATLSARLDGVVMMHATAPMRARRDAGGG